MYGAVQEKLEVLTERLDQATGSSDKVSTQDSVDDMFGAKQLQAVKRCTFGLLFKYSFPKSRLRTNFCGINCMC
jgi:hypothetical protein